MKTRAKILVSFLLLDLIATAIGCGQVIEPVPSPIMTAAPTPKPVPTLPPSEPDPVPTCGALHLSGQAPDQYTDPALARYYETTTCQPGDTEAGRRCVPLAPTFAINLYAADAFGNGWFVKVPDRLPDEGVIVARGRTGLPDLYFSDDVPLGDVIEVKAGATPPPAFKYTGAGRWELAELSPGMYIPGLVPLSAATIAADRLVRCN